MTALDEARAHLAKAREFLTAAELDLDLDLFNVATSNAVISGINAKDATCLRLTGTTGKSGAARGRGLDRTSRRGAEAIGRCRRPPPASR